MPAGSSALKQKHPEHLTNAIFRTEARDWAGRDLRGRAGQSRADRAQISPAPVRVPGHPSKARGSCHSSGSLQQAEQCPGWGRGRGSVPRGPDLPSLLPSPLPASSGAPGLGLLSGLWAPQGPSTLLPHHAALARPRTFTVKQQHPLHPLLGRNDTGFCSVLGTLFFFLQSVHLDCHLPGPSHLPSDCPSSTRSPDA